MTDMAIRIDTALAATRQVDRTGVPLHDAGSEAISDRLDQFSVTTVHALLIGACALGLAMDSMEMSMGGVFSAIFSTPPSAVTPRALSWLLSAVYIGAISGAPIGGWMGDRHGRRISMIIVLLALTVTSILAAFTPGFHSLVISRVLSGVAFGAFPPLMMAYLADFLPAHRRGMFVLIVSGLSLLGPPAGIFLIHYLNPTRPFGVDSWRWALMLGGACSAIAAWLAVRVPESPRWLASKGRFAEAEAICDQVEKSRVVWRLKPRVTVRCVGQRSSQGIDGRSQASPRLSLRRMAMVGALFFLSPWSIVAFPLLSGALLIQKGVRLSDTLFYLGLSTLGPVLGTVVAAAGIDRLERRLALGVCALGIFAAGAVFVVSSQPFWLVASSFTLSLCASLYIPTINIYASELFAPGVRARAVSRAWTMNRIGAAAAPVVLLPLLASGGPVVMFAVIGLALGLSVLVLIISPKANE